MGGKCVIRRIFQFKKSSNNLKDHLHKILHESVYLCLFSPTNKFSNNLKIHKYIFFHQMLHQSVRCLIAQLPHLSPRPSWLSSRHQFPRDLRHAIAGHFRSRRGHLCHEKGWPNGGSDGAFGVDFGGGEAGKLTFFIFSNRGNVETVEDDLKLRTGCFYFHGCCWNLN